MLMNLLLGLSIMALCLLLQALLLTVAIRYYSRHESELYTPSFWSGLNVIIIVMLLLVIGNLTQVAIWALLFEMLGEFDVFNTAFYHSAVNFSTLGYGDMVMSDEHRLLGPLQAINGVLMIGVTTAALMAVFQNAIEKTIQARRQR
ncbi:MAG: two pore domain potassium channel family protein [Gammaproteobacteria bacterium]|nr:two pore domain potassium channel family protein [Gammaproteobacteria bacterium]